MSWTNTDVTEVRSINGERGVFARTHIPEGCIVGVFDGAAEVFAVDADGRVDWRGHDGGMSIHLKLTEGRLFAIMPPLGAAPEGIDYINHSCKPNCRADAGVLVVETIQPVAAGEQLTINYHRMDLLKIGRRCWCEGVPEEERCIL